ncbi:hypothetical protein [Erwinia sp. HR93]|uniref:hypothetical protein n=1 Tax=Erwinia sp. HR93 TaxID=3094840 RepID=UPI002ADEDA99|nr:hypothetical protein [Erwinia sp. HR93]MEA1064764.1 hypothetical protein [Erwinia sp. HR93]
MVRQRYLFNSIALPSEEALRYLPSVFNTSTMLIGTAKMKGEILYEQGRKYVVSNF